MRHAVPVTVRKVGVEEELMLVDPRSRQLTALGHHAVRAHEDGSPDEDAPVEAELFLQQVETQTPSGTDADELLERLRASRRAVVDAAESAGARAVAVGTPVLVGSGTDVTPQPRYLRIREEYGELATSSLASALHVHVDVTDEEEAVRVLDGIAPWLPLVLALSANSPFASGMDTGYASWRSQVWGRWPSHGTGEPFGTPGVYREVTGRLVEWGAALDLPMTYFDARISESYPTVEVRVADVSTDLEHAVLVAVLSRALVTTAAEAGSGTATDPWRSELLRAATWRASRDGIGGRLVDPTTRSLVGPRHALDSLLGHLRPALEEAGDLSLVQDGIEAVLAGGNGAVRQRQRWEETGSLEAVVDDLVERTVASCAG